MADAILGVSCASQRAGTLCLDFHVAGNWKGSWRWQCSFLPRYWQPETLGVGARACLIAGGGPKSLFSAFALIVTSRKEVTLCRHCDVQIIAGLREILVIMKYQSRWYQLAWSHS